ncbi:MAG TPA: tetratricopeptide repeat protein [Chitinophagaceae bacterium]|nr:tetratricopeptide repeat protein [Chitinophagaceae bacterium]
MNKVAKIITGSLTAMIFLISCHDKNNDSAFADILSQQPYAPLTDSIKKEPTRDDLFFRRAVLLNQNNLPEPALADFQQAWSIKKEEKYAFAISTILLDKKPDSAVVFLNKALKELPNSLLLQLTLARGYDAQNKTDDALNICNDLLTKIPDQVDVLKMKADLLDKKGDQQESIRVLEKAYTITPFDINLNYVLADKYAGTNNPKVIRLCDSLIKMDSLHIHPEPYYFKGIYYSNINDKANALAQFNEAIQHDYNYLNAYIEKGRIQYESKKYTDALKTFQLANTISSTFPDAYFWMGKCQEAMGQKEEAKLNYQRAYALDKTFTEAKEAADRIIN